MRQGKLTPTQHARPRPAVGRYLIAAAGTVAVAAGTVALAACGSVAAPSGAGSSGSSAPPAPKVSLHITVQNGPGSTPKTWTLRCDPTGGSHPHAAAACRELLAVKHPFASAPRHVMCPMIMASSKRATFTGTYFGAPVNRTIIDGGCDLAKWSKLQQVMN